MNRFTGKTVLITGGTSGMGLATARRLLTEGAHVIITGRTRARVDSAAQQLGPPTPRGSWPTPPTSTRWTRGSHL
ncbi:SDR family NAD(P)-dependent oxidoreductase [Streptomyces sp. NPDC059567]|uniref:SDR family NAD(P)-dependent oxidoreductase n=1 Tax=Streptomyces sp. NPDC059567 TaxID=3346867 RepID=UPI00367EDBAC